MTAKPKWSFLACNSCRLFLWEVQKTMHAFGLAQRTEFPTLGSHPMITEVINYYLRSDILSEIFYVTQIRDVTFIYRKSGDRDAHIPLQPKDIAELENFLRQFFTQHEGLHSSEAKGQLEPYPWFTMLQRRTAYENKPQTGERRIIGWDSVIELDYGWRRSFGELKNGMQVLDDFGIHYRMKFSGHHSLHFILPAEAMPESFRERPEQDKWYDAMNKVGEFLAARSNYLQDWQTMFGKVCSAPYTVHRSVGLVSIPLRFEDLKKFRPWMATVHLAAPVQNWWAVPADASENFQKLLDYIASGREIFDIQKGSASCRTDAGGADFLAGENGYVPIAINRAQAMAPTAVQSLVESGVSCLACGLYDRDVRVRRQAAWVSMIQGTKNITELLKATDDKDKTVRWFALEAIQENIDVCPERSRRDGYEDGVTDVNHVDDENLVSIAEKLTTDGDEYVRQAALDLLSSIGGGGIARLVQYIKGDKKSSKLSSEAFWTLRDWGEAQSEAGIQTLMQFVLSDNAELRDAALFVMGQIGGIAAPRLIELLYNTDENIRINALNALLKMGEGAVPYLKTVVESKQEPICTLAQRALDGLRKLRRLVSMGVDAVLDCYADSLPTVRAKASVALQHLITWSRGHYGAPSLTLYSLLDNLIAADVDEEQKVNLLLELYEMDVPDNATNLLAEMLMCYKSISMPLLLEKVHDAADASQINKRVISALCRIGTELCKKLLDWLDSDLHTQQLALTVLEEFANAFSVSTEPDVLKKSSKLPASIIAMHTQHGHRLIPHEYIDEDTIELTKERVVPFIESDDDEIRCLAISVLGGLGASKYLSKLSELSQHPDKTTRHAVIRALGKIKDERCLPILTEVLSDDDAQVRHAAAMALGQIPGEKARSVLMKITKSSDKTLARITAKALHSAGSERKSSELRRKRLAKIRGTEEEGELQFDVSLTAVMRTLPEDREYTESELTRIIAQTCSDYSRTRRLMVMDEPNKLMARTAGIFRMTDKGRVIWRVERFIGEHYIKG